MNILKNVVWLLILQMSCSYGMESSILTIPQEIEDPFVTDLPAKRLLLIAEKLRRGHIHIKQDIALAQRAYQEFSAQSRDLWLQFSGLLGTAEMALEAGNLSLAKLEFENLIIKITTELKKIDGKVNPRDSILPNGDRKTIHMWRRSDAAERENNLELAKRDVQEHLKRICSKAHLRLGEMHDTGILGKRNIEAAILHYREGFQRIVDEKEMEPKEDKETRSSAAFYLAKLTEENLLASDRLYEHLTYIAENTQQSNPKYTYAWNKLQAITELDRTTFFERVGQKGDPSTVAKCLDLQLPIRERLKIAEEHYTGQGRPQDLNQARFLFISLESQNEDPKIREHAQFRLSECAHYGLGSLEKNQKLAFDSYNRLISSQNPWVRKRSIVCLSFMLFFGQGVPKDYQKAYDMIKLLETDKKEKDEDTSWVQVKVMMLLGLLYSNGTNIIKKDITKALKDLNFVIEPDNLKHLSSVERALVWSRIAFLSLKKERYGLAENLAKLALCQDSNLSAKEEGRFVYAVLLYEGRLISAIIQNVVQSNAQSNQQLSAQSMAWQGESILEKILIQTENEDIKPEARSYLTMIREKAKQKLTKS